MQFRTETSARPRVCFLFIGHHHQILHAAPVAAAMARTGMVDVHVAASTERHLTLIRGYLAELDSGPVAFHRLWPRALQPGLEAAVPPKSLVLAAAAPMLSGFDAIITPERTSLLLKKLGVNRPFFIHTDHGAGDRAVGYERRIAEFDFTLLAGPKQKARMTAEGLIRAGGHAVVGYPKFDLADVRALARPTPRLFEQDRPVVLYNPHFRQGLSSWPKMGQSVLDQLAASDAYNLIFSPHMRLFETASRPERERLEAFGRLPNVHIDLGSQQSCDMTYANAADLYLGDVSSQVYEFIRRPRACLFLNAHGIDWRGDQNYLHWGFGPVSESVDSLIGQLDAARADHAHYQPAQEAGFADTFDLQGCSSDRAAGAILRFLAAQARPYRKAGRRKVGGLTETGLPAPAE